SNILALRYRRNVVENIYNCLTIIGQQSVGNEQSYIVLPQFQTVKGIIRSKWTAVNGYRQDDISTVVHTSQVDVKSIECDLSICIEEKIERYRLATCNRWRIVVHFHIE